MARAPGRIIPRHPASNEATRRVGLWQFFGEVINELKKVTWPSREETTRLTILVIAISATIGVALGVLDLLFNRIFTQVF